MGHWLVDRRPGGGRWHSAHIDLVDELVLHKNGWSRNNNYLHTAVSLAKANWAELNLIEYAGKVNLLRTPIIDNLYAVYNDEACSKALVFYCTYYTSICYVWFSAKRELDIAWILKGKWFTVKTTLIDILTTSTKSRTICIACVSF